MNTRTTPSHGLGPSLRRARAADARRIAELTNLVWEAESGAAKFQRMTEQDILELQRHGSFLVLDLEDGGLAGAIFVEMRRRRGHSGWLAVAPEYRENGLARRLVAVAEALCEAEGCTAMDLEFVVAGGDLAPWYRSLGYRDRPPGHGDTPRENVRASLVRMTKAL